MTLDKLCLSKLAKQAAEAIANPDEKSNISSYIQSYPKILNAAKILRDSSNPDRLVGIAAIAYSWMPRVLRNWPTEAALNDLADWALQVSDMEAAANDVRGAAQDVREGRTSKIGDLRIINGTLVGTSKFMHLLAPDKFPIWDSVVARHWGLNNFNAYEQPERYAEYLDLVAAVQKVDNDDKKFSRALGCHADGLTPVRCIEFCLYVTAPPKPKKNEASNIG
ncbi:MAG: hypothetical protein U1E48_15975 [Paracoccaceae bacterium]